jgi:leader peptidase (prepilin peptidase)/N-methyltransferase
MFYPLSTPEAIAVAVWLFVIGGAIGSFLNVVVYRLPRGMSLSSPASHCPACSHPIRWRDNLPILGWVLLRGRCRDCGKPIAIRYPLVEAMTATLFLIVAVEGFRQGSNLPQRFWPTVDGLSWRSLSPAEAWGIVAYHLVLLTTLWTMTLIEYDGQRLPAQTALPAFLAGGILPLFWPHLRPVPAILVQGDWPAGGIDGLAGLAVGLTLGFIAWRLLRRGVQRRSGEPATPPAGVAAKRTNKGRGKKNLANLPGAQRQVGDLPGSLSLAVGPALIGLFLGWQAALLVGGLSVSLHLLVLWLGDSRWPALRRASPGIWLFLAALGWILAWKWASAWLR